MYIDLCLLLKKGLTELLRCVKMFFNEKNSQVTLCDRIYYEKNGNVLNTSSVFFFAILILLNDFFLIYVRSALSCINARIIYTLKDRSKIFDIFCEIDTTDKMKYVSTASLFHLSPEYCLFLSFRDSL